MRRGRPRHDDVLTPREWQVLDLLRGGLTNEQIASKLGISPDTAKFHVSEILSKLGVETRQEAAAWQGRPRHVLALWPLAALREKVTAGRIAVAGIAASLVALLLLAIGIVLINARGSDSTLSVQPTPTMDEERFAPNGRTGDAEIDGIIEALLRDGAAALLDAFEAVSAREELRVRADDDNSYFIETLQVPPADWTSRLAASERSLYAVFESASGRTEIVFAVQTAAEIPDAWIASVEEDRLSQMTIASGHTSPGVSFAAMLSNVTLSPSLPSLRSIPSVADEYERYIVLPPRNELPRPAAVHPLSARTGHAGVDRLLTLLEARDVAGLVASLPAGNDLTFLDTCNPNQDAPRPVKDELQVIGDRVVGLQAVAVAPTGYEPPGDHVLILLTQEAPYRWLLRGVLERDGAIAGLVYSSCAPSPPPPTQLYPPREYLDPILPPPPGGLASLAPGRRSGIPLVDAILDALQSRDIVRLEGLIDFTDVACLPLGPGFGQGESGPACLSGEPAGMIVQALPSVVCHGGWARRGQSGTALLEGHNLADKALFVVVPLGEPGNQWPDTRPRASLAVTLVSPDGEGASLSLSEDGIVGVSRFCGLSGPWSTDPADWRVPSGPTVFLLPPP